MLALVCNLGQCGLVSKADLLQYGSTEPQSDLRRPAFNRQPIGTRILCDGSTARLDILRQSTGYPR
jgi:hypothetical protein